MLKRKIENKPLKLKKEILIFVWILIILLPCAFLLSACSDSENTMTFQAIVENSCNQEYVIADMATRDGEKIYSTAKSIEFKVNTNDRYKAYLEIVKDDEKDRYHYEDGMLTFVENGEKQSSVISKQELWNQQIFGMTFLNAIQKSVSNGRFYKLSDNIYHVSFSLMAESSEFGAVVVVEKNLVSKISSFWYSSEFIDYVEIVYSYNETVIPEI